MSKENVLESLAQHLRVVHFTIVITSVAVVAAFTLDEASQPARAYVQLREIVSALRNWDQELIDRRAADEQEQAERAVPSSFQIKFDTPVAGRNVFNVSVTKGYRVVGIGAKLAEPQTLAEFAKFWDKLNNCCIVSIVNDIGMEAAVWQNGSIPLSPGWYSFTRTEELQNAYSLKLRNWGNVAPKSLVDERENVIKGYPIALRGRISTRGGDIVFGVPAKEIRRNFDAQRTFIDHANLSWLKGPYPFSFQDLHEVTDGFEHLDFATLERIVGSEAKRSGQNIETLGVRLPASAVGSWGLAVLLTIQLYFLVNLSVFNARLEGQPGRDQPIQVPWIGLYKGWPSGALMMASLILLPLIVQIVIVVSGFKPTAQSPLALKVLLSVYATFGVSFAILTAFLLRKTRKLVHL